MNFIKLTGPALVLALTTSTGVALAQEVSPVPPPMAPPPVEAESSDAPATGMMLQARMQSQGNLLSLGGGPGFLLGYRSHAYSLGLGVGLTRLAGSSEGDSFSGTLFQLVPTALIDVWQSRDGRARANVIAGVGFGRGALKLEGEMETCTIDPTTGFETCTISDEEAKANAIFVPVMLGLGGDYFFSRNFALGAEGGFQAAILADAKTKSGGDTTDIDVKGNAEFAYGVIRATFVFGN